MSGNNAKITVAPGIATLSRQMSRASFLVGDIERRLIIELTQRLLSVKSNDLTVMKQRYEELLAEVRDLRKQIRNFSTTIGKISELYSAEQEQAIVRANLIPK